MSDHIEVSQQNWYYATDGQTHGPFDETEMAALIRRGDIDSSTWVMGEGMADWIGADQSPLAGYLPTPARVEGGSDSAELQSHPPEEIVPVVKAPRGRRKLVMVVAASLICVWLIANLIAALVSRYEHRHGSPANVHYPIIGESEMDFLSRFDHTANDIEVAKNGLSKVLEPSPDIGRGRTVYLLDHRVVAFWDIPMLNYLTAKAQEATCNLQYAHFSEGYVKSSYRELATIKSDRDDFKDRFGHTIVFMPASNGSLMVFDETVADKLGIQSIAVQKNSASEESQVNQGGPKSATGETTLMKLSKPMMRCRQEEILAAFGAPSQRRFLENTHRFEAVLWSHVPGRSLSENLPGDTFFNVEVQFDYKGVFLVSFWQLGSQGPYVRSPLGDRAGFELVCFAAGRYDGNLWKVIPNGQATDRYYLQSEGFYWDDVNMDYTFRVGTKPEHWKREIVIFDPITVKMSLLPLKSDYLVGGAITGE